jgi:hypothetical protein
VPIARFTAVALLALVAGVTTGCGTGDDREQARGVVERFYDAVRQDQGATACEQLSESTLQQLESQTEQQCDQVITRLDVEGGAVVDAHVYVLNADVELSSGEHAFLSRERGGWRISALACSPEGPPHERPMDCEVEA